MRTSAAASKQSDLSLTLAVLVSRIVSRKLSTAIPCLTEELIQQSAALLRNSTRTSLQRAAVRDRAHKQHLPV